MRIHLDGLTIQCLPGSLAEQANIDGLIVFVDTWLKPHGPQSARVHESGGQRLRGACAEAGPLTLGKVAVTRGCGVSADWLLHCVIASPDIPHPRVELVRNSVSEALRQADDLNLRSVALSPLGETAGDEEAGPWGAILPPVAALPGSSQHLNLVRIIVPPDQPYDDLSMMIVREAARLRQEKGAA